MATRSGGGKMYNQNELIMYLRKSRADRPDETVEEVLEKHEGILQDYASENFGFKIPENQIMREVVSGETIADRPEIQRLLRQIESKKIKAVMVVDPQRLSRGDLEDCGRIVNAFRYSHTTIITQYREYNLEDKYDRKFFEMELGRGNDYLEYTKEILQRGRNASAKKGNFLGSVPPYGYKKVFVDKRPTLEIVPEEANVVRIIFDLYVNNNYGFMALANALDDLGIKPRKSKYWSAAALKNLIDNPVYIGKIRWNFRKTIYVIKDGEKQRTRPNAKNVNDYILVDGNHEAILSEEMFNAAQAKKGKNIRVKQKVAVRNPFSGLLFCDCGRAMSYRTYRNKGVTIAMPRLVCEGQHHCRNKSVYYDEFEKYIVDVLYAAIADFKVKLENNNNNNSDYDLLIKKLEDKLECLHKKDDEQHDLLEEGFYTKEVFIRRNIKLQEDIEYTQLAIKNAKENMPKRIDYHERIATFQEAVDALQRNDVDASLKNMLLKKCIEKITYSRHLLANQSKFENPPFNVDIKLRL